MASKMANEKYEWEVHEKPGGLIHYKTDSQFMPMDQVMKFDEEYTVDMPGLGEYRILETMMGDTCMSVSKGPKFTVNAWTKWSDNFVVMVIGAIFLFFWNLISNASCSSDCKYVLSFFPLQKTNLAGTDISQKTILERI